MEPDQWCWRVDGANRVDGVFSWGDVVQQKVAVMLHSNDEVADFDERLLAIVSAIGVEDKAQVTESVRQLMAFLFWPDFTEWCMRNGRWVYPDSGMEVFGAESASARLVVACCVTVLKSSGKMGLSELANAARQYLDDKS